MTDSNLRSEASAGVSADAISDRHAVVRIELAVPIEWRRSPAEHRARTMHTAGARVETMISRTARIDPFGGCACGTPDEDEHGGEMAHVHILAGAQPSEIPDQELYSPIFSSRIMSAARLSAQDLPFSSERQGRLRAYHGREEPRASARGVAARCVRADPRAFGCCNGLLGSSSWYELEPLDDRRR
jgi:hypothetical protein